MQKESTVPTVFLLQEPTSQRDLSSAEKYGRIQIVIGAEDKPSINISKALNKMQLAMKTYSPEHDVICFAGGDPIVQFLLGIVAERLNIPELTQLIWNRETRGGERTGNGFYVPKKIQLKNKQNSYEDFSHESD